MKQIVDFSNCELSSRNLQYAGRAGEKRGIIYEKGLWFLKFPKNTIGMRNTNALSYVTSPLSEYIGSQIYKILGFSVHETILGICYDGKRYKIVCGCKDFINDDKDEILIPYTALRNDTNEVLMEHKDNSYASASNIDEIIFQLENNSILKKLPFIKERFWDCVIVDILINNNDRNEDNWGVIKFKHNNTYAIAPVFDNGNSFYSKTDETRIKEILEDKEKLKSSATNGVTAYEDVNEKRLSIRDIINLKNNDFIKSTIKLVPLVENKFDEIEEFIKNIPEEFSDIQIMSKERKNYYLETIKIRLQLLKDSLK